MPRLRVVVCSPPPSEPDVPPSIRLSTGHALVVSCADGAHAGGGGPICRRGPWQVAAARLVARYRHGAGPVGPGALGARPRASGVLPSDLFPGQPRVFLAQPQHQPRPQVAVEVGEAAFARGVTVVPGPTPQDGVERVKQRVEGQARRRACSQRLDAMLPEFRSWWACGRALSGHWPLWGLGFRGL